MGVETMVDPRGPARQTHTGRLAERSDTPPGRVVLYDNGKCHPTFGSFHALFDGLQEELEQRGVQVVPEHYINAVYTHLHPDQEELRTIVATLSGYKADAVVLAVGDAGVSDPTVRLALALEEHGIPTVSLYTGLGIQIANGVAANRDVSLPTVKVQRSFRDSVDEVRGEAARLADPVLGALERGHDNGGGRGSAAQSSRRTESDRGLLPPQDGDGAIQLKVGDLYEALTEAGLGDGLPVVPPTRARVDALTAAVPLAPDHIVIEHMEPSGAPLSIQTLAANAVMAGCEPMHFPVVVAACRAMNAPEYRLATANITTHGSGNLVVVSGPAARDAAVRSGASCLGPGAANRANLAVGRTLTLIATTVGRAVIGAGDLSVIGTPAEISYCLAESPDSPWTSIDQDIGAPAGAVTVAKCEAPHNVLDQLSTTPEDLFRGFALAAASGAANNAFTPGDLFLILNMDHADLAARAGWSKRDVQQYMFEHARVPRSSIAGRGIRPSWPSEFGVLEPVPVLEGPEHVYVVVTGGLGIQSAIALPWGYNAAVTVAM